MKICRLANLAGVMVVAGLCARGFGYVDLAPTMAKILGDSRNVAVVKVVEFDRATKTVTLEEVKVLKGAKGAVPLKQVVASEGAVVPEAILQWAEPGAQAVAFSSGRTALVCVGEGWYQIKQLSGEWKLGADRPDLPLSYYGTVTRLADGIEKMLAGRDAVLTMMPHGVEEGASFDAALNRSAFRGLVKVQRLRANLKMPGVVFSVSNSPVYMLGMGPVDETELPAVVRELGAADANARAEAADDLRQTADVAGAAKVAFAVPALEKLLGDENARVRCLAAGAILRITREHEGATKALLKGLESKDAVERRDAAQAAAVTGKAGAALVGDLAKLLGDGDERVVMAALQAVATLGPVALPARGAVVPLLEKEAYQIVAADAMGRMGPGAQPVPAAMAGMLKSDQVEVVKAALRGMAQIGGEGSVPAAEYIAGHIEKASEIDAYNMVIYLALMGPVARGPAAKIKSVPLANPVLPQATNWAMNAETMFPWENGMNAMFGDVGNFIYSAYVTELGERLRPVALKLAPKLVDGTAGAVPEWGYRILDAAPGESVALLAPYLSDRNKTLRERAAVALGYMGPGAAGAKRALEEAVAGAKEEGEQRLMMWALEEVSAE